MEPCSCTQHSHSHIHTTLVQQLSPAAFVQLLTCSSIYAAPEQLSCTSHTQAAHFSCSIILLPSHCHIFDVAFMLPYEHTSVYAAALALPLFRWTRTALITFANPEQVSARHMLVGARAEGGRGLKRGVLEWLGACCIHTFPRKGMCGCWVKNRGCVGFFSKQNSSWSGQKERHTN